MELMAAYNPSPEWKTHSRYEFHFRGGLYYATLLHKRNETLFEFIGVVRYLDGNCEHLGRLIYNPLCFDRVRLID